MGWMFRTLILCIVVIIVWLWYGFVSVVTPVSMEELENREIKRLQERLAITMEMAKGVYYAAKANDISPELYAILVKSESGFRVHAISKKGYKGLAQTATYTGRVKTDLMYGADVLREKLMIANGDLEDALTMYKGGLGSSVARRQAKAVLVSYVRWKRGN